MNQRGRDESLVIVNQLLLSAERGAWQKVVTDAEELRAAIVAEPFVLHVKQRVPRRIFPILAIAYEHLGRSADADHLAKEFPEDVSMAGARARGSPCYDATAR
jgi:hypothetical protein